MTRNEITNRNETALKSLRRARRAYKENQNPETKSKLRQALVEWVNAHDDYRRLSA